MIYDSMRLPNSAIQLNTPNKAELKRKQSINFQSSQLNNNNKNKNSQSFAHDSVKQAKPLPEFNLLNEINKIKDDPFETKSSTESNEQSVKEMQTRVNQLISKLNGINQHLNPANRNDLFAQLQIMEQALRQAETKSVDNKNVKVNLVKELDK